MTDLQDIAYAPRPAPTADELWRAKQKRVSVVTGILGLVSLVAGLAWMTRADHDPAFGAIGMALGFVLLLVGGWFGLRGLLGAPSTP